MRSGLRGCKVGGIGSGNILHLKMKNEAIHLSVSFSCYNIVRSH
jgi:hypothetical protein